MPTKPKPKIRNMSMTCGSCPHFTRLPAPTCRCRPPVPLGVPVPTSMPGQSVLSVTAMWPPTTEATPACAQHPNIFKFGKELIQTEIEELTEDE